jgi:hypothetical protein
MVKRIAASLAAGLFLILLGSTAGSAADTKPDGASPGRQYVVGVTGMH